MHKQIKYTLIRQLLQGLSDQGILNLQTALQGVARAEYVKLAQSVCSCHKGQMKSLHLAKLQYVLSVQSQNMVPCYVIHSVIPCSGSQQQYMYSKSGTHCLGTVLLQKFQIRLWFE